MNAVVDMAKFKESSMKDDLINELNKGEVLISFTKVDGTPRSMKCTLNMDFVPTDKHPIGKVEYKSPEGVQPVFDLEAQGWRSFRWDSLESYAVYD